MLPHRFPKLLVASTFPPNDHSGGGALARQLLKGYPPDRIVWWSMRENPTGPQQVQRHFACWVPPRLEPAQKLTRIRSWLMERFWIPRAQVHLRKVMEEVNAEQIWALPWGWTIPVLAGAGIVQRKGSHVSVWDYPDTLPACRQFGTGRARRFMKSLCSIYRAGGTVDTIGEPMLLDLAERTGRRDGFIVHSGLEPDVLRWLETAPKGDVSEVRIAYAGTILVPETFRLLIQGLDRARRSQPRPVRLEFFGGRNYERQAWFRADWMREHGHLDEAEFQAKLRECTWGLVAMDLVDRDPQYNRFSFPNKFGTYIGAGVPLIVLAHPQSSAGRMVQTYPVGLFADSTEVPEIERLLCGALAMRAAKESFRSEILRCGRTEFNAELIRARLWQALGVL